LAKSRNFGSPKRKKFKYPIFLQKYLLYELEYDKIG